MSDPTEQVAQVLRREFRTALGLKSGEYFPSEVFDHAAQAVVDALGLTEEHRKVTTGKPFDVAPYYAMGLEPPPAVTTHERRLVGPWEQRGEAQ